MISSLSDIAFLKKMLRKIPQNREYYNREKSRYLTFWKTEILPLYFKGQICQIKMA